MIRSKNIVDGVMMTGVFRGVNEYVLDSHSTVYHRSKFYGRLLVK